MSKLLTLLNNEERGTTIIEFAVVLGMMLAMTFAMIDFGRYAYTNNMVKSAAQEGARAGAGQEVVDIDSVKAAAREKLITLDVDKSDVTVENNTLSSGKIIQVEVTYEFEFITPMLAAVAGGPISVSGSASVMN